MSTEIISTLKRKSILEKLELLYGEKSEAVYAEVEALIKTYVNRDSEAKPWVTEEDVMLITYGDSIKEDGKAPLQTMREFLVKYAKDIFSSVHFLPFYPYTSDDGFSVVDYKKIDPELGDWSDVSEIAGDFDLMFDAVINHISKSSEWFNGYLNGDEKYKDYFIAADPTLDYSSITRPRALPLLTPFETSEGTKRIWTTFSDDQIDLNFKNPDVLVEILHILNMYASKGSRFIRLDAIGFMWKKIGTTSMHLEETHALIKLMREVLDLSAPGTILITETNVPHKDNISYFGNGYDEAQMVYQFPLPPLTLFSFHSKSVRKLSEWAQGLEPTSDSTTYFNFLASHDGIGMRPTEGILEENEKNLMAEKTLEHGGRVSYKDNGDGTKSIYELNINYMEALTHPDEDSDVKIKKSIAAHTILLSVIGIPAIYIHSLLGSRNYNKGVEESGINRRINREKLEKDRLFKELEEDGLRNGVYQQLTKLIKTRKNEKVFSPNAKQEVLLLDDRVFTIVRSNEKTGDQVVVLVNVSDESITLDTDYIGTDIISGNKIKQTIRLDPYQTMWVKLGYS